MQHENKRAIRLRKVLYFRRRDKSYVSPKWYLSSVSHCTEAEAESCLNMKITKQTIEIFL